MPKGIPNRPAGSEQDNDDWTPTDADLGVGEASAADVKAEEAARINAAMADPAVATAIEQLVQRRVAELAVSRSAPAGVDIVSAMRIFAKEIADTLNRSTTATLEQLPGHVTPIPAEEVEKRALAWVEMQSRLADITHRYWAAIEKGHHADAEALTPLYILDEDFFGPGEVGNEMYVRGETIRWFGVPGTYMEPRNGIARELSALAYDYLGGEGAPSAEQLAEKAMASMRPSTPGAALPEAALLLSARGRGRPNASRVSEAGIAERGPDGIVGTVVKVTRGGFGHGILNDGPGLSTTGPHMIRSPVLADA
jgi:hypothetical protein